MQYELINLLDSVLGSHQQHSHREYYWKCPFCHHTKPKLAINLDKGAWHCWVCNVSGNKIVNLLKKLNCSQQQIRDAADLLDEYVPSTQNNAVPSLILPSEYYPLYEPRSTIDYKHAIKYVLNRGVTPSDILRYQIGYCPTGQYANRIIIPSYDSDNKLNYFVGRSIYNDSTMKYKNPPISKNIICFENSINWKYPIVLCEGVYDAIAIKRNAVPLLGKRVPTMLLEKIIRENVRDIYLALDNDAIRDAIYAMELFMKEDRNVFMIKLNDKDPSEIGFTEMTRLIKESTLITFSDIIKFKVTG